MTDTELNNMGEGGKDKTPTVSCENNEAAVCNGVDEANGYGSVTADEYHNHLDLGPKFRILRKTR